mmetsp:Transcript_44873/g.80807  ORF Transcript_44873/g.80807 Transcript_44873/m.80807 type:complete len:183 (-) Transcript_44873:182-730(-)
MVDRARSRSPVGGKANVPLRFVRHDGNERPDYPATFHEDPVRYKDCDGNANAFNKRDWVVAFEADCYDGNDLEELMGGEELDDSPEVTVMKWGGKVDVQGRVEDDASDEEEDGEETPLFTNFSDTAKAIEVLGGTLTELENVENQCVYFQIQHDGKSSEVVVKYHTRGPCTGKGEGKGKETN